MKRAVDLLWNNLGVDPPGFSPNRSLTAFFTPFRSECKHLVLGKLLLNILMFFTTCRSIFISLITFHYVMFYYICISFKHFLCFYFLACSNVGSICVVILRGLLTAGSLDLRAERGSIQYLLKESMSGYGQGFPALQLRPWWVWIGYVCVLSSMRPRVLSIQLTATFTMPVRLCST